MRKTYRNKNNFKYWTDRWSSIDVDQPMQNNTSYPLKYSNLIVNNKDHIILEAGCGVGRILRYYHNKQYKIIGIDFIKEAVEKLKKIDPSLNVNIGNILNLEFDNDYFDTVLAFGLYHNFHSENLEKALIETSRVLKKGGRICASFRADNIQELIIDWMNKEKINDNKEFHKLNLTKKEFIQLFKRHGIEVKDVYNVQNMPFIYKFKFFRSSHHKEFNENKARTEGYELSFFGKTIQNFLIKFFPGNFCNIYLLIAVKK